MRDASALLNTTNISGVSAVPRPDAKAIMEVADMLTRESERQAAALRTLFEQHGYDLANGDVLYHGTGIAFNVPPRYRHQVVERDILEPTCICFTRNPRFSLF